MAQLFPFLMKYCTIKMYDGVEARLHVFLLSVLVIGVCSVSRLGDFKNWQKIPSRPATRKDGSTAGLDSVTAFFCRYAKVT
jgi:hypothetical protein